MAELERLYLDRWGSNALPNDDAGRSDLLLWLDHAAQVGVHYITGRARVLAPWLTEGQLEDLIERTGRGKHWKKDPLGFELNLTDAVRTRLDIRTIGAVDRTKAQRAKDCKEREAAAARKRRANAGAKPHALSEARTKPWEAMGVSESTYRRRKRQADSVDSISSGILFESLSTTKHCHDGGAPMARVSNGDKARVLVDRASQILRTHCVATQSLNLECAAESLYIRTVLAKDSGHRRRTPDSRARAVGKPVVALATSGRRTRTTRVQALAENCC